MSKVRFNAQCSVVSYPCRMLALVALGAAAQHETRHWRRHQEVAATHGAAAADDDHELWLRSSGAVNADGKGLLRRQEARFVEDWWCARAGNEETYACRARAARRRIRNETNPTLRRALLRALPRRPTDGAGRKALLEQAAAMRTAYCAKDPDAERKAAMLCAAPRLRQLARRIRSLGQGSSAVAEALLGSLEGRLEGLRNGTAGFRRTIRQYGRAIFSGDAGPSGAFVDGRSGRNATRRRRRRSFLAELREERPRTAWMD